MPDPFATLGDLARTAEDALGACRSRAASLRTRHEALVADGFGDAKGSGITDDPMRDAFDAFDAPARLTLVERFAEALETSHASSEPAATRADSRSSFVRLEARLRLSAKRCEAHLARGARGAALVSHLDGLRALWTAEGALAYKSTTEDFLERVERNRAALLRAWRGALAETLRASDASRRRRAEARGFGETLGDSDDENVNENENAADAAAALAAGACLWLEARVERSSAPPGASDATNPRDVRGTFAEHCARALEVTDGGAGRTRGRTSTRTVDAAVDDTVDASALLARRLANAAAAAEVHARVAASLPLCDRTLTTHTVSSEPHLPSVFAAAAARAVGRALDEALDRRLATQTASDADVAPSEQGVFFETVAKEVDSLLAAFGGARVACVAYSKRARERLADGDAQHASTSRAFEAAFAARRERLETTLTGAARAFAASSRRFERVTNDASFESACAPALRALKAFARVLEDPARMPRDACAPERACAARALAAAGEGLAARAAALLAAEPLAGGFGAEPETPKPEPETAALRRACAASRVAAAAARAMRRLEAVEEEAQMLIPNPDDGLAERAERLSKKKRSRASARVARAARAFAARVAAASASSALLEGAAAQTWGYHRKPEAMSGAQPCSPHVVVWRAQALRGLDRLEAACFPCLSVSNDPEEEAEPAEPAEPKAFSRFREDVFARDGENVFETRSILAAYVEWVAAESVGAYARVVPSRAWRDRYVWDARTIAATVQVLDARLFRYERTSRGVADLEDENFFQKFSAKRRVAESAARALVERAALLRCPASETLASLPEASFSEALIDERSTRARDTDRFERLWFVPDDELAEEGAEEGARLGTGDARLAWRWTPSRRVAEETDRTEFGDDPFSVPAELVGAEPKPENDPWPCAKTGRASLARIDDAWAAAEARLAAEANDDARLAALWHRSELSTSDITPLDPEEAAMKQALVAEVQRRRGGS